jgi:hypothetical protein
MERQIHGFIYEHTICNTKNLTRWVDYVNKNPTINSSGIYTSIWDAIDENKCGVHFNGRPVSIKCIKHGSSVDLGDIFRNSNKEDNFDLIVGFWRGDKTRIVEEYVISVDCKKWNSLFSWDSYGELRDWITNKVSNHKSYNAQWKAERLFYKEKWGNDRIIQPRFKRDSKNQRRIQCGITYNNFIKYLIEGGIVSE